MNFKKSVCVGVFTCLLGATPAWAQTERGFVRGLGGLTFGTADTSSIFGGGGGVNIGPNIQLTGEIGRIQDITPSEIRDRIDFLASELLLHTGQRVDLELNAPAFYGLGGVRFNIPTAGRIRPFVEGQAGFARISFDVSARVGGIDVSQELQDELNLLSETELLLGVGGGLNLAVTDSLGLDLGYRYGRIFTDDPAVNTSAIYAALRLVFR